MTVNPTTAGPALRAISDRYRNPPRTPTDLLEVLAAGYGMDEAAELLWPLLDLSP